MSICRQKSWEVGIWRIPAHTPDYSPATIFLCEKLKTHRHSCKASIGLSILVKMVGGDVHLNVNFALNAPFGAAEI